MPCKVWVHLFAACFQRSDFACIGLRIYYSLLYLFLDNIEFLDHRGLFYRLNYDLILEAIDHTS
jgi:hypothetical protein